VSDGQMQNLDGNGPLRADRNGTQLLGPSKWEPRKIYADSQTFTVPDWDTPELTLKLGVWKDNSRLRVTRGESDGQEAGIVVRIKTGKAKAAPKVPTVPELAVPHLGPGDSVTIDGKADDAAWARAANTGAFVDVGTGAPNKSSPVDGSVKLLWDDASMYLFFEVTDPDVVGGYQDAKSQPNKFTAAGSPKLWENDTVEIMTDPDGDGDNVNYYELQINPQNKVFHSQFDAYNAPKGGDNGPFGHEDWDPKLKSAVVVKGTMDKPDDKDTGYSVEVQIPWTAFGKAKRTPPSAEDAWRMNFYAMKNNGGVAWSPILGQGNFHKASRFGRVRFVGGKVIAPDAGVSADAATVPVDGADAAAPHRHVPRKGILKLPQ
jgi:Carbohydrate family 9 binding domain-like